MTNLLFFVMAAAGCTFIMVDSSLMAPVRGVLEKVLPSKVYEVFTCYQCMGFWTGIVCALTLLNCSFATGLMGGFAGSFVSSLFGKIETYLEAQAVVSLMDDNQ
jgi:hypothetical protein